MSTRDETLPRFGHVGAAPIPRVVLAMRSDGSLEILADRPCRVFITGGLLGNGHAELATARVGWALVTAALDPHDPPEIVRLAQLYEGHGDAPSDTERRG